MAPPPSNGVRIIRYQPLKKAHFIAHATAAAASNGRMTRAGRNSQATPRSDLYCARSLVLTISRLPGSWRFRNRPCPPELLPNLETRDRPTIAARSRRCQNSPFYPRENGASTVREYGFLFSVRGFGKCHVSLPGAMPTLTVGMWQGASGRSCPRQAWAWRRPHAAKRGDAVLPFALLVGLHRTITGLLHNQYTADIGIGARTSIIH